MEEQTFKSDSEELELGSAEGVKDVQDGLDNSSAREGKTQEELSLEELSKLTGREFKDKEDFQKHYKELSSFVGKNPRELEEKARAYDQRIAETKQTLSTAKSDGASNDEIRSLRLKIEEMELLKDNPEASKILPTIKSLADSRGVSLKEAFEGDLKDMFLSKLEAEKQKQEEQNVSIESKSRISSSKASKLNSLASQVKTSDSDEVKEALVREFFTE
jgi:hypothetical protein